MGRVNLSLKERIHLWWLRGYDDPKLVEQYLLSRSNMDDALERDPSTLEHLGRRKKTLEHSLEQGNVNGKARGKTLETPTQSHVLTSNPSLLPSQAPSKEDLDALKKALGISKGSLRYKPRGQGIYLVTYDPQSKRRIWKHLGSWEDLKCEAELKEKAVIPQTVS